MGAAMSNLELPHHDVQTTKQNFNDLGLSAPIIQCLTNVGFTHPTPIQATVIPIALAGHDLIGCAQTGTGKTAAFVLPIADRLTHGSGVRGIILCPTREIATQTQTFIELFGQDHHLSSVVLIGGVKIGPQISALQKNPDIIVATPGRLFDHIERGTVSLRGVSEVVFDEADRMLDMGFLPQIEAIMKHVPRDRHTMMFSATMPFSVARLAERYLRDPQRIDIAPPGTSAEGIEHRLYLVEPGDKRKLLLALLTQVPGSTLIFTRMKQDVERLARFLDINSQIVAARLHADRSQSERTQALEDFRAGKFRILIATDIAGRGLDIPQIAQVINYDVPENAEDYVHRAGRTARYDATGVAATIASWMDLVLVQNIERLLGKPLPRCTMDGIPEFVEQKKAQMGRSRPRLGGGR